MLQFPDENLAVFLDQDRFFDGRLGGALRPTAVLYRENLTDASHEGFWVCGFENKRGSAPVQGKFGVVIVTVSQIIPDEGKVLRSGVELHLTKTEFRLLVELGQNPGRVFSRESLLSKVWKDQTFVTVRSVDTLVKRLRKKIESQPADPDVILTVWGAGYKAADV